MDKDTKRLIKEAERQGFTVQRTKRGHLQFRRDGRVVATAAGTASDHRSWKNTIADLRRAGLEWPR